MLTFVLTNMTVLCFVLCVECEVCITAVNSVRCEQLFSSQLYEKRSLYCGLAVCFIDMPS